MPGERHEETEEIQTDEVQEQGLDIQQGARRLRGLLHRMPLPYKGHVGRKTLRAHRLAGADHPGRLRHREAQRLPAVQHRLHRDTEEARKKRTRGCGGTPAHLRRRRGTRRGVRLRCRPPAGDHRLRRGCRHGQDVPCARKAREDPRLAEKAHIPADKQLLSGTLRRSLLQARIQHPRRGLRRAAHAAEQEAVRRHDEGIGRCEDAAALLPDNDCRNGHALHLLRDSPEGEGHPRREEKRPHLLPGDLRSRRFGRLDRSEGMEKSEPLPWHHRGAGQGGGRMQLGKAEPCGGELLQAASPEPVGEAGCQVDAHRKMGRLRVPGKRGGT